MRANTKRRVLVVHNRYQTRGGEDSVAESEIELLRSKGHDVHLYERFNDDIPKMGKFEVVSQTLWSKKSTEDFRRLYDSFRPDIVHAHNVFPLISPSMYWAASEHGVPVIQTLHNFRLLCAQPTFMREGRICEDCLGKLPWRGVLRKCYRGSATESAALVGMLGLHRAIGSYRHKVTRYIALSEFSRQKYIEGGLPAEKIVVKPNFVDILPGPEGVRDRGIFAGRLSPEKGLDMLLTALELVKKVKIDVVGVGPEEQKVTKSPYVNYLGWMHRTDVHKQMRDAAFLVMPSICYETFGLVAIEAFACGTPVIATGLGAIPELVEHGKTGLLVNPGSASELANAIEWAASHPDAMREMGKNARCEYLAKYTSASNYQQLMAVYDAADQSRFARAEPGNSGATTTLSS